MHLLLTPNAKVQLPLLHCRVLLFCFSMAFCETEIK